MHGLGDDESGWADALEDSFDLKGLKSSGSCRFILPRAPRQRVTCNGGETMTSWFDFLKLPLSASDAEKSDNLGCSMEEAVASCGRVHAAIDTLVGEGIPAERIVVGGFSQGGAMASWTLPLPKKPRQHAVSEVRLHVQYAVSSKALLSTLTYPQRLGGVIVPRHPDSALCWLHSRVAWSLAPPCKIPTYPNLQPLPCDSMRPLSSFGLMLGRTQWVPREVTFLFLQLGLVTGVSPGLQRLVLLRGACGEIGWYSTVPRIEGLLGAWKQGQGPPPKPPRYGRGSAETCRSIGGGDEPQPAQSIPCAPCPNFKLNCF